MLEIFTGIIEEIGAINELKPGAESYQISVRAKFILSDLKIGDSIAVNGVCLTVVRYGEEFFVADVMPETVKKTTLKNLKTGTPVNLERALRPQDRMGGHIVQGHVDGIGQIIDKEVFDIATVFRIKAPDYILRYTVPKGSIAVDGISLTVIDVFADSFTVSIIPHTSYLTTLGQKKEGEAVNLESDIIGRYVEKLLTGNQTEIKKSRLNMEFLADNGFI